MILKEVLLRRKTILIISGIVMVLFVSFIVFKKGDSHASEHAHEESHEEEVHEEKEENLIKLSQEQIKRFDIQTMTLGKSHFQKKLTLSGQISLNENKLTHVVASVPGTVKEIFKGLGDFVKAGDTLASIQSREMAEAKSHYISSHKNHELQKDLFERDEKLWKQKIKAEVQFIQTRNVYENAKITLEQAKQKLLALNMTEVQIENLTKQNSPLNLYTIDSPIEGKVIERHLTLGEVVSSEKQIFVVANMDTVWVNLAIPSEELPLIKKDQKVEVFAHNFICSGTIMYVSPVINEESRTGRAIIELSNKDAKLHPGDFVKAQVVIDNAASLLSIPSSSLQRNEEESIVFKKVSADTFTPQIIGVKGDTNGDFVEVIKGLKESDVIVTKNSFLLKAELGKSEAEHAH